MVKKLLLITYILALLFMKASYSQDPGFSQFYANPIYLNPALAGSNICPRIILNYRNQWPSFSGNFVNYAASYDQYIKAISGGTAITFLSDDAGQGAIKSNKISGIYSYKLKVNNSINLNAGFEVSYFQKKLDWEKFIFADMIDPLTGSVNKSLTGENPPDNLSVSFPDFSTGILVGFKKNYFAGIAVHHLTEPNIEFYYNDKSPLYMKITVHSGAVINLRKSVYSTQTHSELSISPNILYQQQEKFHQINFGLYINVYTFVGGFWYRHNFENPDAVILLIGLQHERFKFGYSYDITVSKLNNATGGAHEVSFAWQFKCFKKRNKQGAIKCPEF
ncbi:MAG: type IX secretion system membrane protein PorP/SprF [Bacteroidales bacterium]|nr:type IX secretion system membrane protein PorP/SprF [Bacteroidales bacterium]